jgi:hypothetical protein
LNHAGSVWWKSIFGKEIFKDGGDFATETIAFVSLLKNFFRNDDEKLKLGPVASVQQNPGMLGLGSMLSSKGLLDVFVLTEPMNFGEHKRKGD